MQAKFSLIHLRLNYLARSIYHIKLSGTFKSFHYISKYLMHIKVNIIRRWSLNNTTNMSEVFNCFFLRKSTKQRRDVISHAVIKMSSLAVEHFSLAYSVLPCPLFSNCMQNDFTLVRRCLVSFRKKNNFIVPCLCLGPMLKL